MGVADREVGSAAADWAVYWAAADSAAADSDAHWQLVRQQPLGWLGGRRLEGGTRLRL